VVLLLPKQAYPPLPLLVAHALSTPMLLMVSVPKVDAQLALITPPLLLDRLTELLALARLTFGEMPKPVHALLATTVVPLLPKIAQPPPPLTAAHALSTPTEMVPHALHALLIPPLLAVAPVVPLVP
jgi:hypothetical protein